MRSFDLINRRTHPGLGLFLTPWLLMYGISSFLISHHPWFRSDQSPLWQPVFERAYPRPIPDDADLREIAHDILKDCGLERAYRVQRPGAEEIRINRFRFWDEVRVVCSIKDQRLRAQRQRLRWDQVILRIHFRGGFQQPTCWDDLWAVLVEVACVGILVWLGSGLIMWGRVRRVRLWGTLALAGGTLVFALLLWRLSD